jgi:hypothetical protein
MRRIPDPGKAVVAALVAAPARGGGRFGFADGPGADAAGPDAPGTGLPRCVDRRSGSPSSVAATGGADGSTGASRDQPWATFAHAWTVLQPGDALVLLDGTYLETIAPTISGVSGAEICIQSDTDGGAVIDGEGARRACLLDGTDSSPLAYVTVEGIVCRRSSAEALYVNDAHHIEVRRVSAYDAAGDSPTILVYQVQDSLLEDVAASGPAAAAVQIIGTDAVTLRRVWGRWVSSGTFYNSAILANWTEGNTIENCIGTAGPNPTQAVIGIQLYVADRNVVRGSIAWSEPGSELDWGITEGAGPEQTQSNRITNSVAVGSSDGVSHRADRDLVMERLTIAGVADEAYVVSPTGDEPKPGGFSVGGVLRDSVLAGGSVGIKLSSSTYVGLVTHQYNDLFGIATPYSGASADATEMAVDPGYDVARYGAGAYLIAPSALATSGVAGGPIGAEVLYRYDDGVLTGEPLWPWPMEDRIFRETGRSVTWASGGGLWTTLDGVYP